MQAEAFYRNGQDGSYPLNQIHLRARCDSIDIDRNSSPVDLQPLLDERLRELVWKGWRRQDLIRFGKFHQTYDQCPQLAGEENGYTIVFPIPQTALEFNHNLKQNPRY